MSSGDYGALRQAVKDGTDTRARRLLTDAARPGAEAPGPAAAVQQVWLFSVIELVGDPLPALSIAWTEYVFDACVP
jgi:hypothetical protein